jgi:hypothetical protein
MKPKSGEIFKNNIDSTGSLSCRPDYATCLHKLKCLLSNSFPRKKSAMAIDFGYRHVAATTIHCHTRNFFTGEF